jgi:hypothetical protein
LRIAPASSYNDPSINPAISDQELEIRIPLSEGTFIKETEVNGQTTYRPINGYITKKALMDYYIYCLSVEFSPRLFLDFDADSCLLITDPKTFIDRVIPAFNSVFPEWNYGKGPVKYIDPLNPPPIKDIEVRACKHFRFMYQREYRFVWAPRRLIPQLEPLFLNIGSMQGYAKLIVLDSE